MSRDPAKTVELRISDDFNATPLSEVRNLPFECSVPTSMPAVVIPFKDSDYAGCGSK
jgi:hypothetical protein